MFSVEDLSGTEGKIILQSNRSRLEILPACGGILNAWYVQMEGGDALNIIEGYDSAEDFAEHVTNKGFRSCKMNPFVGRMNKDGFEFLEQQYLPEKFSLKEMPIHGLVYDIAYDVVQSYADDNGAMLQLEVCYPATDPGFPFQYTIMLEYVLMPDETLTINTLVLNQHEEVIPMADGWHPYFNLGNPIDECTLQITTDNLLEFDDDLVPTGEVLAYEKFQQPSLIGSEQLDNSFLLQHPLEGPACTFTNPVNGLTLQVWPDVSYPILHLYTPPGRRSLAIENTSAAPNAFNNDIGLVYLQPGESYTFSTTFKIIA